jgi:hypothetical protein
MRTTKPGWLLALLVTLSPCHLVTLSSEGAEPAPKIRTEEDWTRTVERLLPGMTTEQVRQILGSPRRIGRQILYQRYIEQWVYETPRPFRLDFDCHRGQPPSLLLSPTALPPPRDGAPMPGKRPGG